MTPTIIGRRPSKNSNLILTLLNNAVGQRNSARSFQRSRFQQKTTGFPLQTKQVGKELSVPPDRFFDLVEVKQQED